MHFVRYVIRIVFSKELAQNWRRTMDRWRRSIKQNCSMTVRITIVSFWPTTANCNTLINNAMTSSINHWKRHSSQSVVFVRSHGEINTTTDSWTTISTRTTRKLTTADSVTTTSFSTELVAILTITIEKCTQISVRTSSMIFIVYVIFA